jgi:1-acyl-sn-glycerol-3-phosphate acyltransferase
MSERHKSNSLKPGLFTLLGHRLYGIWFWTVFACLASGTLCIFVLRPDERRCRHINRIAAGLVLRLTNSWPHIQGFELIPEEAAVVVANHSSYIDAILLAAVLPDRFRFVIKKEVTQVPLMNFYLNRIGAHFVERFDSQRGAADTRKIFKTAANGDSLAMFPEGTFRTEAGLRGFHKGAFKVAIRKGLPLVPLTIVGTRRMLSAANWLPRPTPLKVIIAEPLHTHSETVLADSMEYCRQHILDTLDEPDLQATPQSSPRDST